ncbi:hypothetical protein NUW54_g10297 [Trametes sanguinea]|uniref:Uncharacterized protein n=1 Tax=Trametes sanguinea TaxID=158606 RepID=A0ACC1P029_9APHY|nr:hypothetical protein NUW54_g10297 [Trametes sanguinea]
MPPSPPPPDTLDNIITQVVDVLDPNANYLTRVHNGFESLYQYARLLPRVLGPYVKIETAFLKGGALAAQPGYLDNLQPGEKFDSDEECAHCYGLIAEIWPLLIDSENYLRTNPDAAVKVLDFIDKAAARARGDDLSRLRHRVIHFVDPTRTEDFKTKTSRGFKNAFTGRMLCPITKLSDFDADPAGFLRGIRDGVIKIKARDWPLFLYDENMVVPGQVKPGLFRNTQLIKWYQVIFTGPQSADPDLAESSKSTGKPSLAKKYGIVRVTPESICYIAALVRFLLNSQAAWALKDGHFEGPVFVRSLMRVFARNPKWMDTTLKWWNEQVYKTMDDDADEEGLAADLMDREGDDGEGVAEGDSENEQGFYAEAEGEEELQYAQEAARVPTDTYEEEPRGNLADGADQRSDADTDSDA